MLYLIGSIVLTSYLTLSFKMVERFRIPVLQAIVFNYFTCVLTGSVVNGSFPLSAAALQQPWFFWALLMGGLFVSLFNLIAFTTQRIGVAVASVANKLSLVIPFLFSLYLYNEPATTLKIAGILLALASVVLTCLPASKKNPETAHRLPPALLVLLPLLLFLGSGLLDTLVKYVEQRFLNETNSNAYLIASFATAGVLGAVMMLGLIAAKKQRFEPRSILAGILIGIPNYFSIWCLVRVLKLHAGNSSAIIPINNMGIVLFSSVAALLLYKERLSVLNWAGILLSLGAIALIAFG